MAIHIPPAVTTEVQSRESRRRSATPPPPFVPPAPSSQKPAQVTASPAAAVQVQRQKQRTVQQQNQQQTQQQGRQQSAAARERREENMLDENALARDVATEASRDERRSMREEIAEEAYAFDASAQDAWAAQGSEGGDQAFGGAATENISGKSAAGEAGGETLDMDELSAHLLPPTGDDGIFEVTLPNGQKMGVAVNMQPGNIRYHLSVSDEKTAERLRDRKMELQGHVERRIQQNVEIILL
jgi:hypothetical protein